MIIHQILISPGHNYWNAIISRRTFAGRGGLHARILSDGLIAVGEGELSILQSLPPPAR